MTNGTDRGKDATASELDVAPCLSLAFIPEGFKP